MIVLSNTKTLKGHEKPFGIVIDINDANPVLTSVTIFSAYVVNR